MGRHERRKAEALERGDRKRWGMLLDLDPLQFRNLRDYLVALFDGNLPRCNAWLKREKLGHVRRVMSHFYDVRESAKWKEDWQAAKSDQTKHCRDCQQDKPLLDFSRNRKSKDGRATYCRLCMKERNKKYQARPAERSKTEETIRYESFTRLDTVLKGLCKESRLVDGEVFSVARSEDGGYGWAERCPSVDLETTRKVLASRQRRNP